MVALFFALEYFFEKPNATPEDSVVWLLAPHTLNEIQNIKDVRNLTPSISSKTCLKFIEGAFYPVRKEPKKVIAVMAHDIDMRIFVQQGCFTIHSSPTPLDERKDRRKFLSRLTIPAQCARDIARQLRAAGLRRGDIYPDLANLSVELVQTQKMFRSP